MKKILKGILTFYTKQTLLFWALILGFVGLGLAVAYTSQIQAFPEFTNVQVQVITQYPGKAAKEIERQLTVPLEVALNGTPGLTNQRSISVFGLSVITLTFDDSVKSKQARQDVRQKLAGVDLPEGVTPELSPDSTPIGEIYRYTINSPLPLDEQRLIQEWVIERELKSIPGVADIVGFGGPSRTIEVQPDMDKLRQLGLSIVDVAQGLSKNHANAGGSFLTHGEENYVIRSLGTFQRPEDLESAVIATIQGIPIKIRDIGQVVISHRPRLGQVGFNQKDDVIEGIILLRQGYDSGKTCQAIREKIQKLNSTVLPKEVKLTPFYDRTDLIKRCSHTIAHNVVVGIILVLLVLTLGFGLEYWNLTIGVAIIIPFALLCTFLGLNALGYSPNLISLGAVDFGIIVETAIFAAEAVMLKSHTQKLSHDSISQSISEVLSSAFLCAGVLLIAFIPILGLQSVEGRIFRPLGITLVCALVGGQLGALIFVPIFSTFGKMSKKSVSKVEVQIEKLLHFCEKQARKLAKFSSLTIGVVMVICLAALFFGTGREFLPPLNEGSLYIRSTAPPTISREAAVEMAAKIRATIRTVPEVKDVISQIGRPDDGTDVNGFDNIETLVTLKPPSEWKTAHSIDGFVKQLQAKFSSFEGIQFSYSQPIKDNVDEAISGVKGELVIKVFGSQLETLQSLADKIKTILQSVPGAEDVSAEQLLGQPELQFQMNRELLDRYSLGVTDVESVLESALLGKYSTKFVDAENRSIDVLIKPFSETPPSLNFLKSLPILTPNGAKVTLGEVTIPGLAEGVSKIYREQSERRVAVKCSVRGRPVVDFVNEASQKIDKSIHLPEKYRTEWSGSFQNAQRASKQLMIIVPICFLAMVVILYAWFKSWKVVGLLLWELPFAFLGGLFLLTILHLNLSISAACGAIILIGLSFLTGMMFISYWKEGHSAWETLHERGPGILLSNMVAIVGLIPSAFSHGVGAEIGKPFAVMILGGLTSSLLLTLVLLPAILSRFEPPTESSLS